MKLNDFFKQEKQRVIEDCTKCGLCVKHCDVIGNSQLSNEKPKHVQNAVIEFFKTGKVSDILHERIKSCMKCYGCLDVCPQDINPLRSLEICQWEMAEKGHIEYPPWDPKSPDLIHRVLASIQINSSEYDRIFRASEIKKSATLFFPGCNVYYQPEKILNSLDIMEMMDPESAYLPGLDSCCGNCHLTKGRPKKAGEAFTELMESILAYQPETLVLWCPTCFCLAETTFGPFNQYPFTIKSMPQYISEHLDRLDVKEKNAGRMTVHDACKVALTGLDVTGARPILGAIGADLVEMPRSKESAVCCGCAAIVNDPPTGNKMLDERIDEAAQISAQTIVTVCHFCSQMLASKQDKSAFKVDSYINLLAASLGINREDKFKKYMSWADPEKIVSDAKEYIAASPFSKELICQTIEGVFGPKGSA